MTRALSAGALAIAVAALACSRGAAEVPPERASPACVAMTGGAICFDDGGVRPCVNCPAPRRPAARFACSGDGSARRCTEKRPRQPDDGDWECSETSGVTLCRGGLAPAGVSRGAPDPGWVCGEHVVQGDAGAYPRVCVDFAPDYPSPEGWTCRYAYVNGLGERTCEPSPATRVGDACAAGACPSGSRCASGRCLPEAPRPQCFFDADCAAPARCVFGACRAR